MNKRKRNKNWLKAVSVIVIQTFLLSNVTYAAGISYNSNKIFADKAMLSPSLGIADMKGIFAVAMQAKLPGIEPAKEAVDSSVLKGTEGQTEQKSILIVEDEEQLRKEIAEYFANMGYDVQIAASLEEALRLAKRRFDVVLCDFYFPGGTAIDVAAGIRESNPETPIMLWSSLLDEAKQEAVKPVVAFQKGTLKFKDIFNAAETIIAEQEQKKDKEIKPAKEVKARVSERLKKEQEELEDRVSASQAILQAI